MKLTLTDLTRGGSLGFAGLVAVLSALGVCWDPQGEPARSPDPSPAAASARLLSASSLLVFICLGVPDPFLAKGVGASAHPRRPVNCSESLGEMTAAAYTRTPLSN